jgi:divalent metal cation (Fe/Co/Zn/Cd) transporter
MQQVSTGGDRSVGRLQARDALVHRGLAVNYATIAYNSFEAVASLIAGSLAGTVALIGFGIDSLIEVTASGAAQWRLRVHSNHMKRASVERITLRIIGWSFLGLALYVTVDSARSLYFRERPDRSWMGIVILGLSVLVIPWLARAKRSVARQLEIRALEADAKQTSLCAYLSVIALIGLALNGVVGWWWADPVAALAMVPIIAKEGVEGLRGDMACADCA